MTHKNKLPPQISRRQRFVRAARHHGEALAEPGSRRAEEIARLSRKLATGKLTERTSLRQATSTRHLTNRLGGPNPEGFFAEVIAADALERSIHGDTTALINGAPSKGVVGVEMAADPTSTRDLLYVIQTPSGRRFHRAGPQIKTGSAKYVARSLTKMAESGRGSAAVVDAKFVTSDGRPRIGPDAFTVGQARGLEKARVKLRGVTNLHAESARLARDYERFVKTGVDPATAFDRAVRKVRADRRMKMLKVGACVAGATIAVEIIRRSVAHLKADREITQELDGFISEARDRLTASDRDLEDADRRVRKLHQKANISHFKSI